ncbi:DUF559 domain-containing protein [Propionibacteriaceae bacterium Y2011]
MKPTPRLPDGVARTATLHSLGISRAALGQLVTAGQLQLVRRGWWSVPDADPAVVRAVRLGGHLTCVSALARHGLWIPEGRDLHLRYSLHQRRSTPSPPGGVRVCLPPGRRAAAAAVDPLPIALTAAGGCVSAEEFVAILDSATHRLALSPGELAGLLHDAPASTRRLVQMCDRAESGSESLVRVRLRSAGVSVRPQVVIAGVGRVDLLVGRRLVLEIDSRAHHTGTQNHSSDRTRDRRLIALGYLPMRFTYHQVMHSWDDVWPDLLAVIRRGEHLREPRAVRRRSPGRTHS